MSRTKMIALIVAVFALVAVVVSAHTMLSARSRLMNLQSTYTAVEASSTEFMALNSKVAGLELRRKRSGGSVISSVDRIVQSLGIKSKLKTLKAPPGAPDPKEDRVDVVFEDMSLNETVNFLHSVSISPQLLVIRQISFRSSFMNPELFNINISLSLIRPQ